MSYRAVTFLVMSREFSCWLIWKEMSQVCFKSSLLASSQNNLLQSEHEASTCSTPTPSGTPPISLFTPSPPYSDLRFVCLSKWTKTFCLEQRVHCPKRQVRLFAFVEWVFFLSLSLTFVLSRRETRAGARTHTYGYFSALRVTWRAEN